MGIESLDIPVLSADSVKDEPSDRQVLSREVLVTSRVQTFVKETFELGDEVTLTRDFIEHPGAVIVAALNERQELLMIRQYRHPARSVMWELPAGLLDVQGERPELGAPRELSEEADLAAAEWQVLVDFHNSAGGSNEATRVFLATGLSAVPLEERHVREDEEAEIERAWVPVDEAVAAVFAGQIHNSGAVVGILAVSRYLQGGAELRRADASWDSHPAHRTWA